MARASGVHILGCREPATGAYVVAGAYCIHSGEGQSRQQGPEPTLSSLAAAEALAVSVLSCGCTLSPWACTLQWKPLMGVGLVMCHCTAGGASSKYTHCSGGQPGGRGLYWHLALEQLQRPELAAIGVPGLSWGRVGEEVRRAAGGWCRQTWIPVSWRLMKSAESTWWLCLWWPLALSQWQNLLGLSAEQVSEPQSLLLSACCQSPLLFLLVPSWLYTPMLSRSAWDETEVGPSYSAPKRLEKLGAHPPLPFLARGTLSSWEVPCWHWRMLAWGMGWCKQDEAVFFLFFWGYSEIFCFTVWLKPSQGGL